VRELSLAQGVVEKKNTIPILSNIRLRADKDRLELSSTDLEIGLIHGLTADVIESGEYTVSAKKLYEIVRSLPEDEVSIEVGDGGRMSVSCARSKFSIVGLDPVDFPVLPECDFAEGFEIGIKTLASLVHKVLFAVTMDESRFPLAGSLFIGRPGNVEMVATDGHRLSHAQAACELKGLEQEKRFVIPKKTLSELKKALELGGDESVTVVARDNHIFFRISGRTFISRGVEDQFPAYEKVLPQSNNISVSFAKAELEGAVRRVSLLAPEKGGGVKLRFADGSLKVSSSNPDLGDANEELACEYAAEPLEIGFNAQYIVDFLSVTDAERVAVKLKDGVTQGLFEPEGESEEVRHQYVIMPMRI
jgi:DNA polymerase-3 subunit beta